MDLARSEFYLAEVLSAMDMRDQALIPCPDGIFYRMPESLFIIGTANADATTFPFSPRVLDRAFYSTSYQFSQYTALVCFAEFHGGALL